MLHLTTKQVSANQNSIECTVLTMRASAQKFRRRLTGKPSRFKRTFQCQKEQCSRNLHHTLLIFTKIMEPEEMVQIIEVRLYSDQVYTRGYFFGFINVYGFINFWVFGFVGVHVVVQFFPWFNFYFLLFLCMVMYDNEYKTGENKN